MIHWLQRRFYHLRCRFFGCWQSNGEWGYGGEFIDWYCPGCQTIIDRTLFEDASDEVREMLIGHGALRVRPPEESP